MLQLMSEHQDNNHASSRDKIDLLQFALNLCTAWLLLNILGCGGSALRKQPGPSKTRPCDHDSINIEMLERMHDFICTVEVSVADQRYFLEVGFDL